MIRVLSLVLALTFSVISVSEAATKINVRSSKYAALVMDADTGEVLFSRNADKKRYPASLTKMMTLYMLFEALSSGEVSMSTRLKVSAKAASQPQTNISLKSGESIRVSDAIRALVVRSANDVALVIAEALAGSQAAFATQMTKKARQLGMRRTVFRNPHGLPDKNQFTTSRDMAKLSIALRRDFPQYYNFFKTTVFRWKGKTYKSHNKVLGRFNGVDGIKTGYIRMSGFNLATSVKRDGYHIVAVVMGGQNSKARDNHMLSLLSRTFTVLNDRGDRPRVFANAPVPVPKPDTTRRSFTTVSAKTIEVDDKLVVPHSETVELKMGNAIIVPRDKPEAFANVRAISTAAKETLPRSSLQPASLELPSRSSPNFSNSWGIQVGAFQDQKSALYAAANAVKMARDTLRNSKIMVSGQGRIGSTIHRARLANLSETEAKRACRQLVENNAQCFVFKTERLAGL
ncbi:MAG: D-alanyl-D-alanine carboxypeptidase [Rickettsiales bacterium]|nr:D-alanyl-D-alanine carboxypeptidase [Rickettsiales bacterium]